MDAQVLGISVDSVPSHEHFAIECNVKNLPLLSDLIHDVAKEYGVLLPAGHTERATLIVDKDGIVRWKQVNPLDKQRSNEEILKALEQVVRGTRATGQGPIRPI